mmetsp:Transcript_24518/g.81502  ORF Transcript_24518/g.81502 Transcript_24518/m.81502 type:complete len:247 (-) Transcript_24518:1212-1952(-)
MSSSSRTRGQPSAPRKVSSVGRAAAASFLAASCCTKDCRSVQRSVWTFRSRSAVPESRASAPRILRVSAADSILATCVSTSDTPPPLLPPLPPDLVTASLVAHSSATASSAAADLVADSLTSDTPPSRPPAPVRAALLGGRSEHAELDSGSDSCGLFFVAGVVPPNPAFGVDEDMSCCCTARRPHATCAGRGFGSRKNSPVEKDSGGRDLPTSHAANHEPSPLSNPSSRGAPSARAAAPRASRAPR